jgi:hypothetical protein
MTGLASKIVTLSRRLTDANFPHAFGGALALAWCTEHPRGTVDIDVNIFAPVDDVDAVVAAFPRSIRVEPEDRDLLRENGQARLWWDKTPVDVFLNTTDFHEGLAGRIRVERFNGADLPFLSCTDLAVFKAFFNRTKDWADLEAMAAGKCLDLDLIVGILARLLGPDDERISRLIALDP